MLSEKQWSNFGRWMMVISGVAIFALLLNVNDSINLFLKVWVGLFGLYAVYM